MVQKNYDIIVIGAGHAGIEAACAAAKKGHAVLLMTINLDSVGLLPCNPSIGGTAKGNLVKEIDALGGIQGRLCDQSLIQLRMLNESKGVAVHSLRAQVDKSRYHASAKNLLEETAHLTLRQAEAVEILHSAGRVTGVLTARDQIYHSKAVVVATGVYLKSDIIVGDRLTHSGPAGLAPCDHLSASIEECGHSLRRFKTGTPPRISAKTVDFSQLELQSGADVEPFSWATAKADFDRAQCYLGYTNETTHAVIRANLSRSGMYSGLIHGTGARYCPSIEDKIVRFHDKSRHQFFLEPEGLDTAEWYVQGISTSMPADVQSEILHSIQGLENAHIMRDAYAIEYDCIDSLSLRPSLESKRIAGLYFAGQINGTSGYEEAAAQGLLAGLNAALDLENRPPLLLSRSSSYIGVLIDDLVTKGTNEPYRMMTSRAEYRLTLRQSNSDLRLTPIGREAGLVDDLQWQSFCDKCAALSSVRAKLDTVLQPKELTPIMTEAGEPYNGQGLRLSELFKRSGITAALAKRLTLLADDPIAAILEVLYDCRYEGYLKRQEKQIAESARLENVRIPTDFDYAACKGLRIEAQQKLAAIRPDSVGRAGRISGVNPADITVLLLHLKGKNGYDSK